MTVATEHKSKKPPLEPAKKREGTRYGIRALDHSNYPEIVGRTSEYEGDIAVFRPASELAPKEGDIVHIEVKDKDGLFWAIREYAVTPRSRVVLQAIDRSGAYRDYRYGTKREKKRIKILGVFVELRREARCRVVWPLAA